MPERRLCISYKNDPVSIIPYRTTDFATLNFQMGDTADQETEA